jgi:hypothetical protein
VCCTIGTEEALNEVFDRIGHGNGLGFENERNDSLKCKIVLKNEKGRACVKLTHLFITKKRALVKQSKDCKLIPLVKFPD